MAKTDESSVVCDAGPLIHLDEMKCLDLLGDFAQVLITRVVMEEATRHRPNFQISDIPRALLVDKVANPTPKLLALANSMALDVGERSALALMEEHDVRLFLCDDAAARLAAESLGFTVHGTIGVIVRAKRVGLRTQQQVLNLLRELPRISTLHLSPSLLARVIEQVERESL